MLFDNRANTSDKFSTAPASHHVVEMGSEYSFGVVFAVVFAIIGLWPVVLGDGIVRWWAIAIAFLLSVVAILLPRLLRPFNRVWFRIGMLLGRVVSPIVMLMVFFAAVTPTALIMRMLGKDLLRTKKPADKNDSLWIDRTKDGNRMGSMRNQF